MGGGGPIPHDDEIYYDSTAGEPDYFDYRGRDTNGNGRIDPAEETRYFSGERSTIFRYCIISHYIRANGNIDRTGRSNTPGTQFMIADGKLSGVSSTEWAMNFIHELGHSLGLKHPSNNNHGSNPTDVTSMYTGIYSYVNFATDNAPHSRGFQEDSLTDGNEWRYISENLDDNLIFTRA
jgi:hypothetical protein